MREILGNSENRTRGCWVRSRYATSVLCTEHKITFVSVSENPGENSVAVLLVVDPVALVRLEQHRVVDREVKDPVAVGRPVLPLPEVLVAVGGRVSSQACKGDRD